MRDIDATRTRRSVERAKCLGWLGFLFVVAAIANPAAADERGYPAQITTYDRAVLSAEISGRLDRFEPRMGDVFDRGQILVSLDCGMNNIELQEAKSLLESAKSIARVRERLHELDSSGALELALARAEVARAKGRLDVAQATVEKCVIAAPWAGRVEERIATSHQYVRAGEPILAIMTNEQLEVELILPSSQIDRLSVDAPMTIEVDHSKRTYPMRLVRWAAKIDAVSQTIEAIAAIDGAHEELLPGMSGVARFANDQ